MEPPKNADHTTERPLYAKSSAQHRESFAFATVSKRLPVILTKVIDTVYKYRKDAQQLHGQQGAEDCKFIVGKLSALKNCMQTDKALEKLTDDREDVELWNGYLDDETERCGGDKPRWFKSAWLYVECYMYRAITEAITLSQCLKTFDPFSDQKQTALLSSLDAVCTLTSYLDEAVKVPASFEKFADILQISLWGNKCDLSISAGIENSQKISPVAQLAYLQPYILADNIHQVWQTLCGAKASQVSPDKKVRLDVVLDNAGFELLTDLVLVDYLLQVRLIDEAHFHLKAMPWFVSDVVRFDWDWTLQRLQENKDAAVSSLGQRFQDRLRSGVCILHDHLFWTTCYDFCDMKVVAPELYQELSNADLLLFKGDLNYRKLVADRSWPHTTPFEDALCGFHPAPLCTLRTLKCDTVVGLKEGLSEKKEAEDKDWMVTGQNAVIQFCNKIVQLSP
ncbi:damage-control phosphatase ARMT1-like [Lytechinus pictus]|uniref:damage-control phosphatase ARMT1-like n=1 Tax=Lytechinus pictus TaxID=7653 RepID=UPI0030B9C3DB